MSALTPEQVREIRGYILAIQHHNRDKCVHRPAGDDKPTIPVPPPDAGALRPPRRPHVPRYVPEDNRPTTPPPADTPEYPR